jgi:virginiamycin B lyase
MRLLSAVVFTLALTGCAVSRGLQAQTAAPEVHQTGAIPINWTQFTPGTPSGIYLGIARGPDNNIWFTDPADSLLLRITNTGLTTHFRIHPPPPGTGANNLAVGADNKLYVEAGSFIAQVTTSGTIRYFSTVTDAANLGGISKGPDGNVWFLEKTHVAKITPIGTVTEYPFPSAVQTASDGIAAGPDGNVWFGEGNAIIAKIVPATGAITEYNVSPSCSPSGIGGVATGSDGNVWFDCSGSLIQITPNGASTRFFNPWGTAATAADLTRGADGKVWFVGSTAGVVGNIDPKTFTITAFVPPSQSDRPQALALGRDGNFWLTTATGHIDVYIIKVLSVTPSTLTFTSVGQMQTLTVAQTGTKKWTATTSNAAVATVVQGSPASKFVVTARGSGSCTITVKDSIGNSFSVSVTVQ